MRFSSSRRWLIAAGTALCMLVAGAGPVVAQAQGTVRGRVFDRVTERPLTGARIVVVGTQLQGVADDRGNFQIRDVPAGAQTLRVMFVGYSRMDLSVTVNIGQEAVSNFGMQPTAISLDEIVVTGTPGTSEKRTLGNAVSSVKVEEFVAEAPIANVVELLSARTPGLTLVSNSGQVGTGSNVRIRGAGSIYGGYQPVYYIDGIRFEAALQEGGSTVQAGTALDFINPKDIESIEVIKGPAAATLYGADAASGVIQIITKKGSRGQEGVRWTASAEYGQNEWTESVGNPLNYWRCTESNQGSGTYPGCQDPTTVEWWGKDANGDPVLNVGIPEEDITAIPGTNDFLITDNPLRRHPVALRTGDALDLNLSATGGGRSFSYFLSMNRNEQDGVFFNNFSRRTAGRANFDFNVAETFDMAVQFSYARTADQQPLNNNSSNSILRNAFRGRARAYNDPWEPGFRGFNPFLSNQYNSVRRKERMTIGLTMNWDPWQWFQNKLTLGLDKQDYRETTFYEIDTTGREPWGTNNSTGAVYHDLPITHTWTMDYAASLDFDINPTWSSKFSGGMQLNARQRKFTGSDGWGLVANNLNLVSSAANVDAGESFSEQTSLGFYVQEEVGWRNRMFITGAVRIDDNSAFGSDFSLVVYPKASFSWVVSEEDFFNLGWMQQLKLRAAWGQAGNAPAPFSADRTYQTGVTTIGDASTNFLRPSEYGNPDLQAETGREFELGFDASLLDGKAGLEFTYYDQKTNDALVEVPDPRSTGFLGDHLINIGEITNTGLELLVTGTPVYSRNFAWDVSVSLSTNKNRLKSFNGAREEVIFGSFDDVQRHREGYPLGAFWAYDVERGADGEPVLDAGGDVTVNRACRWAPSDPAWDQATECDDIYIGPSIPTRESAVTNTFTVFGNLRIFAHFDYRGGHYQWCAICSIRSRVDRNTWDVNTGGTELNPDVSDAEVLALRARQTLTHITQADFIKFRELSLTYSIPQSWGSIFASSRWSFTVSGRNLWMWTKYEGTGDPEVQFNPYSTFTRLDYASMPQLRRLSASARVSF